MAAEDMVAEREATETSAAAEDTTPDPSAATSLDTEEIDAQTPTEDATAAPSAATSLDAEEVATQTPTEEKPPAPATTTPPRARETPTEEVPADRPAENAETPDTESTEAPAITTSESVPAIIPSDSLLVLTAEATDSTWVEISIGENVVFSRVLLPGEKRSWRTTYDFLVRSGRPHGIRYSYQGRRLGADGLLGNAGGYLRFRVSEAGTVLLDANLQPLSEDSQP